MCLDFEYPTKLVHPEKYKDLQLSDDFFLQVPAVVTSEILENMGAEIPIDPQMPLIFLRQRRLGEFVVAWFMEFVPTPPRSRFGKATKFFRALEAIEQYRSFLFFPTAGELGAIPDTDSDPILAGGGALAPHLLPQGEEEADGKDGEPQATAKEPDAAAKEPEAAAKESEEADDRHRGLPRWRALGEEDSDEAQDSGTQAQDPGTQPQDSAGTPADPLNDAFVDDSKKED